MFWGGVCVALVVAAIAWSVRRAQAQQLAWRRAAGACGLAWIAPQHSDGPGRIQGTLEGFEVELRAVHPRSEASRPTMMRASLTFPQRLPTSVHMRPRRLVMVAEEGADAPRVGTGDAEFDALFELRSPHPEAALALLTPRVRERMRPLAEWGGRWCWEEHRIVWEVLGVFGDEARVKHTLDAQVRLAQALSAALMGESAHAFDTAPEAIAQRAVGTRTGA